MVIVVDVVSPHPFTGDVRLGGIFVMTNPTDCFYINMKYFTCEFSTTSQVNSKSSTITTLTRLALFIPAIPNTLSSRHE